MSTADVQQINYNDIAVYRNDIELAESEYISMFPCEEDLYNTDVFNGLIGYIYTKVFKPDKRTKQYKANAYNRIQNSNLDYSDVETLNDIWDIYKLLCAKYKKTVTQHQFCVMCGISKDAFNDWLNGNTRNASNLHSEFAKKVNAECEAQTLGKVINTNSIGAMFILKSGFGWREDNHIVLETSANNSHDSADQIAERHKQAMIPEKPQFD